MRRSSIVALAAALLPALIDGQGASSMHPIDFDGDGDIDIVKSSPIGIVWLENHGVDKEWETHIISLNQNIKDAVAAHKRHRKFVDVMEGRGFAPVSALSDEPPVVVSSASGLGCVTLMAVGVEPPPPPPGKGQDPIPATVLIVEGSIDRLSALELGVATKPAPPPAEPAEGEEALPAGLGWSVTAVSAGTLTLAKDTAREEELKALSASWEAAAPGRAVKAKESRDKYRRA